VHNSQQEGKPSHLSDERSFKCDGFFEPPINFTGVVLTTPVKLMIRGTGGVSNFSNPTVATYEVKKKVGILTIY